MADPNVDPYYNAPYTDDFMNIINNLNPSQSSQKSKDAIDIGSSEALELWDFQHDPDLQCSPLNPLGINGETSNQIETNLAIQEPVSFPLPSNATIDIGSLLVDLVPENSQSDPSRINWGMSNQSETNLGNEIQEPFSFPCLIPPFTEETGQAIVEYNGETGNQIETNLGPSLQVEFGCRCCEILREIVHIEGRLVMKLQIHGRLVGVFFHAVLDVERSSKSVSREMFDFYEKSFEEVKQFLTLYCMKRKQEGYTMMKDPNSSFFEALCIGFDWYENLANGADPGNIQMDEATNNGNNRGKLPHSVAEQVVTASNEAANNNNKDKSPISLTEQRKRVKEMTFKDLANYFHLPRKEAAQKLGLSETVVHNIWCKGSGGLKRRWPYRKIHSKVKEILKLRELSNSDDPQVRSRARDEIRRKEEELAKLYKEAA